MIRIARIIASEPGSVRKVATWRCSSLDSAPVTAMVVNDDQIAGNFRRRRVAAHGAAGIGTRCGFLADPAVAARIVA